MIYKFKCVYCGNEFIAESPKALYCSEECRHKMAEDRRKEKEAEEREQKRLLKVAKKKAEHRCQTCVWKSWQDHKRCVMPSCFYRVARMSHD